MKTKNAPMKIKTSPTTVVAFRGFPSQVTEKTANTIRVIASWMVFSCAVE
jgi:hypothetical protein